MVIDFTSMTKHPLIQAVDHPTEVDAPEMANSQGVIDETLVEDEPFFEEDWSEDEPGQARRWVAPALAIFAVLGWTALFLWARQAEIMAGTDPAAWTALVSQWAVPVLLVVALWLVAMRNSTREARRFSQVAYSLSTQSAELEARLAVINRELSLAREFLTSQTRDLDYLGRTATDRLSEHADRLQALIVENGDRVETIATVSANALDNMDKLRNNLPVIANSAKDVSNQIGGAGRQASGHLDDLIEGFQRLNEFGAASERQVASLRKRVDASLEAFAAQADQLADITEQRFSELRENSEIFRGELDSREVDALASIRSRFESLRHEMADTEAASAAERDAAMDELNHRLEKIRRESSEFADEVRDGEAAALSAWASQIEAMQKRLSEAVAAVARIDQEALDSANSKLQELFSEAEAVDGRIAERNRLFAEETGKRQAAFREAEEAAHASLTDHFARLDEAISDRRAQQAEQLSLLAAEGEELGDRIAALSTTFERVSSHGREARVELSEGIEALNAKLAESRDALDGTDMAVSSLTDASVRLLELIQASAKHSREDLPVAMEASETRLANIEHRADEVRNLLDQAKASGEMLTSSMAAAEARSRDAMNGVDEFQARFGETAAAQVDGIERLRASVAALSEESQELSAHAQGELRDAIASLESSARNALTAIEAEQAERIARIAEKVGEQSAEAIDRSLKEHTEQAIASLDDATERSAETGREVMRQLRDQLAKVNELTGNLESRIAHARERATEDVGNDFSRRVALISESLNSNAIDIAKALSTEITDTAWASYLRGDRGIFTRRAVRLLDNAEAREIADLYDSDHDFREHVSRYIHDFEAMLRTMLSTRDGNAVSVTLLSSDMGKLYVVLAQALERLR